MPKKSLINTSMVYGDVHAIPLDFVRELKKEPITFNYDCLYIMTPQHRNDAEKGEYEQTKVPFDTIKFKYEPRGENFLRFSLKKICYELMPVDEKKDPSEQKTERKGIKYLKMIYLNTDGKEEVLLDTSEGKMKENFETIEFADGEIIEEVIVYEGYKGLCGFSITTNRIDKKTNKENYKLIGVNSENSTKILGKDNDQVAIGIGCYANETFGVTGIYFYFVNKITYSIYQTYGMRQLRAKLKAKCDEKFAQYLEKLKPKLNEEEKLVYDICNSAETVFFPVLKYLMPY